MLKTEISVEMFSRPGCHLCDLMLRVIEKLQRRYRFVLTVTDVSQDADLEAAYGERLPVLRISGAPGDAGTVLQYPIAEAVLEAELERLWKLSTS